MIEDKSEMFRSKANVWTLPSLWSESGIWECKSHKAQPQKWGVWPNPSAVQEGMVALLRKESKILSEMIENLAGSTITNVSGPWPVRNLAEYRCTVMNEWFLALPGPEVLGCIVSILTPRVVRGAPKLCGVPPVCPQMPWLFCATCEGVVRVRAYGPVGVSARCAIRGLRYMSGEREEAVFQTRWQIRNVKKRGESEQPNRQPTMEIEIEAASIMSKAAGPKEQKTRRKTSRARRACLRGEAKTRSVVTGLRKELTMFRRSGLSWMPENNELNISLPVNGKEKLESRPPEKDNLAAKRTDKFGSARFTTDAHTEIVLEEKNIYRYSRRVTDYRPTEWRSKVDEPVCQLDSETFSEQNAITNQDKQNIRVILVQKEGADADVLSFAILRAAVNIGCPRWALVWSSGCVLRVAARKAVPVSMLWISSVVLPTTPSRDCCQADGGTWRFSINAVIVGVGVQNKCKLFDQIRK
ncbi:hypothetical protein BT96DRAFT_951254 [Gymnopus androsaceus JB14]|uniref:Uncharacterized protein n=1 Tax=Gymnopus androsaceus JB14 TaxID=1447944 RepID=A0A6A4GDP3_9AGAR|nr:hypothetical protein BT96DRAFT_951254 [Gymnopus androsaceus JB14]